MNLKELIAASTPGPLRLNKDNECVGDVWSKDEPFAQVQPRGTLKHPDNALRDLDGIRLAHSYNMLPEVVDALRRDIVGDITTDELKAVLKKVNTISP